MRIGRIQFWFQSPLRYRVLTPEKLKRMKEWQKHVELHPDLYKNRFILEFGMESVCIENGTVIDVT